MVFPVKVLTKICMVQKYYKQKLIYSFSLIRIASFTNQNLYNTITNSLTIQTQYKIQNPQVYIKPKQLAKQLTPIPLTPLKIPLPPTKMTDTSDNLSIQLQQNFAGKSNQQILQQFQQITRRIAQSDRNNIIYRQMKKTKTHQLTSLTNKNTLLTQQYDDIETEYNKISSDLMEAKSMIKKNEEYYQMVSKAYEAKYEEEKHTEGRAMALAKENEKLEKKYASLQAECDELTKGNRDKQSRLNNLRRQKEQKSKLTQQNEQKIESLQRTCQHTKLQAQQIEKDVKHERQIFSQLKALLQEKQHQLHHTEQQREDLTRRQEQTRKGIARMMAAAKSIEEEIDRKMGEMRGLEKVYGQYEQQVGLLEQSQKRMEELLIKRREIVTNLKKCSGRIAKEKQANKKGVESGRGEEQ